MQADDDALAGVIRDVCDGRPIDWDSAELSSPDESFRRAIAELRVVAGIANLHRSFDEDDARPVEPRRADSATAPLGRWGHLHLLDQVGSGAFGDVYQAWDPGLDREVALKVLRRATGAIAGVDTIEEGRLLARVRHPNVITVYGAARIDGRVGLWMELVRGRTLAELVHDEGPLPTSRVVAIATALCGAIEAVHRAGLLHRDIKAQNVMEAEDGRIVLMDFGAGREAAHADRGLAGTPLYLAPEVLRGSPASVRSDVYSLGVLLYFLSTGTYPVAPAPEQRGTGPVVAALARALEPDPERRYPSADALGAALSGLPPGRMTKAPPRRFAVAALLVVSLAGGATGALLRLDPAGSSPRPIEAATLAAPRGGETLRRLEWSAMPTGAPSLDGRHIGAIDWSSPSGAGLPLIVDLQSGERRALYTPTAEEAEWGPYGNATSVSPDGRHVVFSWYLPGPVESGQLRVSDLHGRDMRVIFAAPSHEVRPLGWSADGSRVLAMQTGRTPGAALLWIDVASGVAQPLMRFAHRPTASLNPNGRDLVFDRPERDGARSQDLLIADTVTGHVRPLLRHPADDAMPVWLTDGRHVVFASNRGGSSGAWLIDATVPGAEPRQVRGSMGWWQPAGVGGRGELYYIAQTGTVDVYTAPVDLARGQVGPRAVAALSFSGRNLFADWGPDSRHLAFTSRRGPLGGTSSESLVLRHIGTEVERELPAPFGAVWMPRWSPDGAHVAVGGTNHDGPGIHVVTVVDGRSKLVRSSADWPNPVGWIDGARLLAVVPAQGTTGPDGDDPYRRRLLLLDLQTGSELEIQRHVQEAAISRRADRVAFLTRAEDSWELMVAHSDVLEPGRQVFRMPADVRPSIAGWSPDDLEIIVVRPDAGTAARKDGRVTLLGVPAAGGAPRTIARASLGEDARSFRLSADGMRLAYEAGRPTLTAWVLESDVLRTLQ